jgi:transposase
MAKTGRPQKKITIEEFEKLCGLHCTQEEIAAWFECSIDTITRWCKRIYGKTFAELYNIYKAKGKISLRRLQLKHAEKSPYMAWKLGERWGINAEAQGDENDEAIERLLEAMTNRDDI